MNRYRMHREIPADWHDAETIPVTDAVAFLLEHCADGIDDNGDRLESFGYEPETGRHRGYRRYRQFYIRHSLSGDYVGSFVERSNCAVLVEDIAPSILYEMAFGYGATAAGFEILLDEDGEFAGADSDGQTEWPASEFVELVEALDAMEAYPSLDEDAWSEMEREALDGAWEECRRDLERYAIDNMIDTLAEHAPDIGPDAWHECPAGWEPDPEGLIARYLDGDNAPNWDVLQRFESVEGTQAYVDADELARAIIEWAIEDGFPIYRPAPWATPGHPDFDLPASVGKRASLYNREVAEIRNEALRVGSTWDMAP